MSGIYMYVEMYVYVYIYMHEYNQYMYCMYNEEYKYQFLGNILR